MSIEIMRPAIQTVPLVFASPHSGQHYPSDFIALSRLDPLSLRRSEDAFMDEVFASAVKHGAPLLRARFARAYVDLNREAYELDPKMFEDDLPDYVNTTSARAAAGLGTIARIVSHGEEIYRDDVTGQILNPELVQEARKNELEYFASKGVLEKRPVTEARMTKCADI